MRLFIASAKSFRSFSKFLRGSLHRLKKARYSDMPNFADIQRPCSRTESTASRNRKRLSERSILSNSRPKGFARPTTSSRSKCVTKSACTNVLDVPEQEFLEEEKSERIVLLKNLAKLLVDRIEAACAARQPTPQPCASNHKGRPQKSDASRQKTLADNETHLTVNLSVTQEKDSAVTSEDLVSECAASTQKNVANSDREMSLPSGGRSSSTAQEKFVKLVNGSRPSTQEKPAHSARDSCAYSYEKTTLELNARVLPLKKVNLGLDGGVSPHRHYVNFGNDSFLSPRGKRRFSGLNSLVVRQGKNAKLGPHRRPASASDSILSRHSKLLPTTMEEEVLEIEGEEEEIAMDDTCRSRVERGCVLFEAIWEELVTDVLDGLLNGKDGSGCTLEGCGQVKENADVSTAKDPTATLGSAEVRKHIPCLDHNVSDSSNCLKLGGHCSAELQEESVRSPSRSSVRLKNDASCSAPVILPTVAKYHMDMIERYRKCIAQNRPKKPNRTPEQRPIIKPDYLNVYNVYTQRCASREHQTIKSTGTEDRDSNEHVWERTQEFDYDSTDGTSTAAEESDREANIQGENSRLNEQRRNSRSYKVEYSRCTIEEDQKDQKVDARHQQCRGDRQVDARRKKVLNTDKAEITVCTGDIEGKKEAPTWSSNNKQEVELRRRFMELAHKGSRKEIAAEQWAFLDHQIEAYIQAHILQCCILFRSLPQFLQF